MNQLLHNQVYAGLMEILRNSKYYYHSSVGEKYSSFTDEGKEAVIKWVTMMAPHMINNEKETLDTLAKQMVFDELKK